MSRRSFLVAILTIAAVTTLADDGQWGQFWARKEREDFQQSLRDINHHHRYDPNPRGSSVDLTAFQNSMVRLGESLEAARQQRAQERQTQALFLVETLRLARQRAEEEARRQTLVNWNALKQRGLDGDADTAYRVARLIRWGEGRLPKEQKTGDAVAEGWYRRAADAGHAEAAYELAFLVEKASPAAALRYYSIAAKAGKVEAVHPAAVLAADGVAGQLPPNPSYALQLCRIGVASNDAPSLTIGAWLLLDYPELFPNGESEAVSWLERAADRSPAAAGRLAWIRLFDRPGHPKDWGQAVALAKRALKEQPKQPDALLALAVAQLDGLGGEPVNGAEAVARLEASAAGGRTVACYVLALVHQKGLAGRPKSTTEMIRWRLEAAKRGHRASIEELAYRYAKGIDVTADPAEGFRWAAQAVEMGSGWALGRVAEAVIAKKPFAADWTPARLRSFAAKAAEAGEVAGQEFYAAALSDGFGGPKDGAGALQWYRKAAEAGGRSGQYSYAMHLLEGVETPKDAVEAYRWMKRSADNGHDDACAHLAWQHATGTGCEKDLAKARDWARIGAERGSLAALRAYGSYLGDGVGGPVDGPQAIQLLQLAVEQNDDRARLQLADYLRKGLPGVPADSAAARKHYELAAQSKIPSVATPAKSALAELSMAKPVSLDGLRINAAPAKTNRSTIYDSLKIK